jgi:hypothetical protein
MRTFPVFSRTADSSVRALRYPGYRGQLLRDWTKNIPGVRQVPTTQWLISNDFEAE